MIVTTLQDSGRYIGLSAGLDKALAWLLSGVHESLPEGRHDIDGDKVFALVSRYSTKSPEACKFETHTAYLDIQVAVAGQEDVEVTTMADMEVLVPYKPDVAFWKLGRERSVHRISLQPGVVLVLFPEDVHKPSISPDGIPVSMHKVVIKVAV